MADGTNNPLANVLRFGFTPQGNFPIAPSGPGAWKVVDTSLVNIIIFQAPFGGGSGTTGTTGFRHEPYLIYGLGNPHQVLRFGRQVAGSQGGSTGTTGFRHEPYLLYGLGNPHRVLRFGRQPIGAVPVPGTDFQHEPHVIYGLGNPHQVLRFGRLPVGTPFIPGVGVWSATQAPFIPLGNQFGFSFREILTPLNSGSSGQVRVTFGSNNTTGDAIDVDHCSIGVQSSGVSTTATPVELTFNGASGYHKNDPFTLVSDWVNLNFTINDTLIVIQDMTSAGNGGSGAVFYNNEPRSETYNKEASATYNQATETIADAQFKLFRPSGVPVDTNVILVETQGTTPPPGGTPQESEPFLATPGKLKAW